MPIKGDGVIGRHCYFEACDTCNRMVGSHNRLLGRLICLTHWLRGHRRGDDWFTPWVKR